MGTIADQYFLADLRQDPPDVPSRADQCENIANIDFCAGCDRHTLSLAGDRTQKYPAGFVAETTDDFAQCSSMQIPGCNENLRHLTGDAFHKLCAVDFLTKVGPGRND